MRTAWSPRTSTRLRRLLGTVVSVAAVGGMLGLVPVSVSPAAAASAKITICHRTHSVTNPYRRITVAQPAVQNGRHGGHTAPTTAGWPQVFDPSFPYPSNQKLWGDIIPGASGAEYNGSTAIALNWTEAGIAMFRSPSCGALTAKEFYDVEVAAGQAPADIIADLNEQGANEDAALLASLGGTFTLASLSTWESAVSVTTSPASGVTATGATLNGSITVGAITTATGFEYGTSATLDPSTAVTSVRAAPASVISATTAVSAALSGLAPATTYYFRVTGTTNAGLDTEGILRGAIASFTTPPSSTTTTTTTSTTVPTTTTTSTTVPAPAAQMIDFRQPDDMVLGSGTQAASATATSGLDVTFTSGSPEICTVTAGGVVTAVATGTCSVIASQPGDATWAAATPVTRTFEVTAPVLSTRTLAIDPSSYDADGYLTSAVAPTITATPSAGGGTITFSSDASAVCAIDGATGAITFVSAGACTIRAAIGADDQHAAAVAEPVTFPVIAAEPPPTGTTGAGVRGTVWFDRNRSGTFDAGEWVLPGVRVTLSAAARAAGASAGTMRAAAAEMPQDVVTGSDGSYVFTGLAPGAYRVVADVTIRGFDRTSDTDGALDWTVDVTVPADEMGVADFAGLGRGELVGEMYDETTLEGLGFATITCRWGGYDDVLGTADDLAFEVVAEADGSFALAGVPYGYFTCSGLDEDSDRESADVAAAVFSPAPVEAPLPVLSAASPPPAPALPLPLQPSPPSTPSPSVQTPAPQGPAAAASARGSSTGRLAATGSESAPLLQLGALLVLSGCTLLTVRRRMISRSK